MSKADEMFNELGYEKFEIIHKNKIEFIEYRKTIKDDGFSTIIKIIELHNPEFYISPFVRLTAIIKDILRNGCFDLSAKELQAINEKCKELRWLDE